MRQEEAEDERVPAGDRTREVPADSPEGQQILERLLGPLARDVPASASSQADYVRFLLCLVFLRNCAHQEWSELKEIARPDSDDAGLAELIQRVGALTDIRLRVHGLAPDLAKQLERLRLSTAAGLAEVVRLVDQLGSDAFDPLLDRFGAEAKLESTEFFTPREVSAVMARLATGEASAGHPVYDPYLRGGESLKAASSAGNTSKPPLVIGESPNPDTLQFAAMNLMVHGLAAELRLSSDSPWDDHAFSPPLASAVLTNIPFNGRGKSVRPSPYAEWPFGPPPRHRDNYAWIQHAIMSLAPGGTAAVLMPNRAGTSTNKREYEIRQEMVERGAVHAIIVFPPQLFPSTGIGVTLWVVTRPIGDPSQVLFIDARAMSYKDRARHFLNAGAADSITDLYHRRRSLAEGKVELIPGGGLAVLAGIEALRQTGYSLNPADYTVSSVKPQTGEPAARAAENFHRLADLKARVDDVDSRAGALRPRPREAVTGSMPPGWSRRPLAELCHIQAGPSYSRLGMGERTADGTVPVVMPRHLRGRRVIAADADMVPEEVARQLAKFRLTASDIVCVRSGTMGEPALADDRQEGWLFGNTLLRIRIKEPHVADASYLLGYLSLPAVMTWVRDRSTGTATPSISVGSLGELPIALPPLNEQQAIGSGILALDEQIAAHRDLAQAAERVRTELAERLMDGALIL